MAQAEEQPKAAAAQSVAHEPGSPGKKGGNGRIGNYPDVGKDADPENLQNILNGSGIATLALDRDLRVRFFTPAVSALFEITPAMIGRPLADIRRRFADDDLLLDAQTVIVTKLSLWREVEAENGTWYNRRLLPYRTGSTAGGKDAPGVVITFADISEMKAAEREIEAARAYSNSIVDAMRQALVVLDHEMRVVSASPSFYRSFALTPAATVGLRLPDLLDRCLDVPALRGFLALILTGQDAGEDTEIEIELPSRGRRVLQLNAREIPATPPARRQTLLAIDDVTDRKRTESALEAARRQAERANLGKSRFLAAASHDLRQPLQTLTLLQGILAAKVKDDSNILKLVARFGDSLDAMAGMLNKLLDINQLEAGIVNPELDDLPVATLFERLRAELFDPAGNKGLSCRVVPCHLTVRTDPTLLEQMVRNLISNALKYTARGKVLLGCRRHGDHLRIEVWDTGPGIPEAQLRAVFEEFHQLDNPARERARGLGLGLSIVQRLADLLGHRIDVRSTPGKGSVFSIEVPCSDLPSGSVTEIGGLAPAAPVSLGETVLVIEDDPAIREVLQMLFEIEGYRVSVATDGKSALALVGAGAVRPDIVVADYNLPNGLSGLDVALSLRKSFDQALPVLIVTGDISTQTLRMIAAASCTHLNKPIKADELIRLVRSGLAAPRRGPEPSPGQPVTAGLAPTVFLIDDDDILRETMRELIELAGHPVETFASGEAFLEAYLPGRTGCLLVDARLPGLGGLALLQRLKAGNHALPSIMITGHGEVAMAVEAMKAGAIDFIEKPARPGELLASIARALELTRDSTALSDWRQAAAARIGTLTPREHEIMELVIAGHPNKIIAADLDVSQRTVENHRAAVMKKTGSKSLSDLVRLSIAAT